MKSARIALALVLSLAAPAIVVSTSAPAKACGSLGSIEEENVRAASFAYEHDKRPKASTRVRAVKVQGAQAKVLVDVTRESGSTSAQILWLSKKASGAWTVGGESYFFSSEAGDQVFSWV